MSVLPEKERDFILLYPMEDLKGVQVALVIAIRTRDTFLAMAHLRNMRQEIDRIYTILEKGLPTR
jgi:hypothetical protein